MRALSILLMLQCITSCFSLDKKHHKAKLHKEDSKIVSQLNVNDKACCGQGTKQDEKCSCIEGFIGDQCEYSTLTLKYSCQNIECGEHGKPNLELGSCDCDAGYKGFLCNHLDCGVHGSWGCPSSYCSQRDMECVCQDGFEGLRCEICNPLECTKGQGAWESDSCMCECLGPWGGEVCNECVEKECDAGLSLDSNTCGCVCKVDDLGCLNDGIVNDEKCSCECVGGWGGEKCGTCLGKERDCSNGGSWNDEMCMCDCVEPYTVASYCEECPIIECLHGSFNKDKCACECENKWMGDSCDSCPGETELILFNIDCGSKGFNYDNCVCNDKCPLIDCQNGGHFNADTCSCDCNIPIIGSTDVIPSFWSGALCDSCDSISCDETQNLRKNTLSCTCDFFCPESFQCLNGGIVDENSCTCQCPPQYSGPICDTFPDGQSSLTAGKSCQAISDFVGSPENGMYWLNPSGKHEFQTYCEYEKEDNKDSSGWAVVANIKYKYNNRNITSDDYMNGLDDISNNEEYIIPCNFFDGMDGDALGSPLSKFIMKIEMGDVVDYFKPSNDASFCDLITSQNKHLWALGENESEGMNFKEKNSQIINSKTNKEQISFLELNLRGKILRKEKENYSNEQDEWTQPLYNEDSTLNVLLGGCSIDWPKDVDGRDFISFWGGNKGGCCHYNNKFSEDGVDEGSWGRNFKILIQEAT